MKEMFAQVVILSTFGFDHSTFSGHGLHFVQGRATRNKRIWGDLLFNKPSLNSPTYREDSLKATGEVQPTCETQIDRIGQILYISGPLSSTQFVVKSQGPTCQPRAELSG